MAEHGTGGGANHFPRPKQAVMANEAIDAPLRVKDVGRVSCDRHLLGRKAETAYHLASCEHFPAVR